MQSLAYFPYGKTRTNTGSIDVHHKYTSQELDDSTGLYFYNSRYYDPALGRFVSADSIIPNPRDPQALNRYSYVRNNPIVLIDPSGHRWKWLDKQMDRLRENERFQVIVGVSLQALGSAFFVPGSALLTQNQTGRKILVGEAIIAAADGSASAAVTICFTGCTTGIPLAYIGGLFGGGAAAGLSPGGSGSSNSSDTPEGGGTQVAGNFVYPCKSCADDPYGLSFLLGGGFNIGGGAASADAILLNALKWLGLNEEIAPGVYRSLNVIEGVFRQFRITDGCLQGQCGGIMKGTSHAVFEVVDSKTLKIIESSHVIIQP